MTRRTASVTYSMDVVHLTFLLNGEALDTITLDSDQSALLGHMIRDWVVLGMGMDNAIRRKYPWLSFTP